MSDKHLTAKFAGTCSVCGGKFPVGTAIVWASGKGARHADAATCQAVAAAKAAAPVVNPPVVPEKVSMSMKPVADFILAAKARGLKFPKVRFLAPGGGELRLSLSGEQSKVPGSIQVVVRDEWVGRVEPDGAVVGWRLKGNADVLAALATIAANPAQAAKAYGALMNRCSFCDLPLTDAFSVEHGYGPVCAKRWGLEHKAAGAPALKALPLVDTGAAPAAAPTPKPGILDNELPDDPPAKPRRRVRFTDTSMVWDGKSVAGGTYTKFE